MQVITAILVPLKKHVVTKENELDSGKSYVEIAWEMHFLFCAFENQHKLETEAVHIIFLSFLISTKVSSGLSISRSNPSNESVYVTSWTIAPKRTNSGRKKNHNKPAACHHE